MSANLIVAQHADAESASEALATALRIADAHDLTEAQRAYVVPALITALTSKTVLAQPPVSMLPLNGLSGGLPR